MGRPYFLRHTANRYKFTTNKGLYYKQFQISRWSNRTLFFIKKQNEPCHIKIGKKLRIIFVKNYLNKNECLRN